MATQLAPIASDAPIVASDPKTQQLTGNISTFFRKWLLALTQLLQAAVVVQGTALTKATQNAALVTTTLWTTTQAGLYRVTYTVRVVAVDGVSSSVQVTIGWLDGGVAQTQIGATVNGDTTVSRDQTSLPMFVDANSTITIAASYASNTPGQMKYTLRAIAELVQ